MVPYGPNLIEFIVEANKFAPAARLEFAAALLRTWSTKQTEKIA